ncbi:MAG TPA: hypothetical protein VGL86_05290 [Polyangia bacterium]|jgi:hypothetical protein
MEATEQSARPSSIPWFVWCTVVAVTSAMIGGHWDISWHRSIGRDAFWTAPHIAIYLCGVLAGVASAYLILSTTFGRERELGEASVSMWGFRGPLGAFIAAWGGVAMLTSAPFDDWWHSAYGLDVKIISPPHALLSLGIFSVQVGALLLILGYMNRSEGELKQKFLRLFLYVGGTIVVLGTLFLMEETGRTRMHTAEFYRAVAIGMPFILVGISRAAPHRWACTIMAALYTIFQAALIWILPLFHAEPKLGPVYYNVTHFVPPGFPLLLMAPAVALDLLRRVSSRWGMWRETLATGAIFVAVFIAAQWPFADFLQSPWSRNWFFGTHYFGYYEHPTRLDRQYRFGPSGSFGHFAGVMAMAIVAAMLGSALGLRLANWMRRIKR